ncbi:malto-oligosyltrehalose synthase [Tundrisphaera lichenicola]|uniref:malto-oligosyltrehalose synthase n=1 Tax=Tundrisphaera lichenicola TaxID=2029860 RepID=UPI003EBFEC55
MPVPMATYRVQMHAGFGFDAAAEIAVYLSDLGVTHLYASPYLQAGKGSTHGYDVLDHSKPNAELGGIEAQSRLCEALGRAGLGQILDIVPNHMSIASRENKWWWDVLENGQSSRYAAYFDVDWHPPEEKLRDTVLMPILGDHYGREVEAGRVKLQRNGGTFTFEYFDHVMPVAPRSFNDLLNEAARKVGSDELAFLADSFGNLPHSTATDFESVHRRHRDKEVLRSALNRLCVENPGVAAAIDAEVAEINDQPVRVDALLERQNYRLAFWKTAGQELDYRRFFDINTLISLRMEDQRVFDDSHRLILEWVRAGVLDGLRVDHPDGLRDPAGYFQRLQRAAPNGWIVVEKILEPGEALPEDWPVAGTTGYDFLNRLGGLFVDPAGEGPITDFYSEFTGESVDYIAMIREKKLYVLKELFGSDVSRLVNLLSAVCERQKRYRDYTKRELTTMIREVIACFPVYRTYVQADEGRVGPRDIAYIDEAIEAAKANRPEIDPELLDFLRDLLTLRVKGSVESSLVMRFQQNTGPVMAKGVEDTTFYNFNRLVVLNEVGGDPNRFGLLPSKFHEESLETQRLWATSMTTTTTHDTKRSEDVRARISLLSEIPRAWAEAVGRWAEHNLKYKTDSFPDRNAEYLLYQILVGAWPIDVERATAYMLKAARESKAHTSWTDGNEVYEEALKSFIAGILGDREFVDDLGGFVQPLIPAGRINSLSQALIKLTAPGVPDIYQGNELWDMSLVDPDNRRPVDYAIRRRLLGELDRGMSPEEILGRTDEGLPKLWVTSQALRFRRRKPELFGPDGEYAPIMAEGARADHVVAFARGGGSITIAPRLPIKLGGDWGETSIDLPPGKWSNELTGGDVGGGRVRLVELLARFPVALLSRGGP